MSDSEESNSSDDLDLSEDIASDSAVESDEDEGDETENAADVEVDSEGEVEEGSEMPNIKKKNIQSYLSSEIVKPPTFGFMFAKPGQPAASSSYVSPPVSYAASPVYVSPQIQPTYVSPPVSYVAPPVSYVAPPVAYVAQNQPAYVAQGQPAPYVASTIPSQIFAPGGVSTVNVQSPGLTFVPTASPKKQGAKVISYTREGLEDLRLEDLKNLCKLRGIKGYSAKKKADIITMLLGTALGTEISLTVDKSNVIEIITIVPVGAGASAGVATTIASSPTVMGGQSKFPVPMSVIQPTIPIQPFGVPSQVQLPAAIPSPIASPAPVTIGLPSISAIPAGMQSPSKLPAIPAGMQSPSKLSTIPVGIEGSPSRLPSLAPLKIVPGAGESLAQINTGNRLPTLIATPVNNPITEAYRQEMVQQSIEKNGNSQLGINIGNVEANKDVLGVTYSSDINAAVNETFKV
jgi:hypothetical protein